MLRSLAAKVLETLILEERASCIVVDLVVLIIDAAYDVLRLRMRLFAHLPIKKVRRWGRVGRLVRNAIATQKCALQPRCHRRRRHHRRRRRHGDPP